MEEKAFKLYQQREFPGGRVIRIQGWYCHVARVKFLVKN